MEVLVVSTIRRYRSLGIMGLRAQFFLFPRAYVGPLVVCRNVLTQLPVRSCSIIVITVKVLARH